MATDHYCVFEVDSEFFAASATQIREITSKPDYAKAPCSSPILAGLWHEGSEFVPVLRIPFQIGEPQNENTAVSCSRAIRPLGPARRTGPYD